MKLGFVIVLSLCLASIVSAKKKKSKKAKTDASLFDGKTLNCLVCKSLVEEIDGAINKVDPAKKVESGSHRLNGDGTKNTKLVSVLANIKTKSLSVRLSCRFRSRGPRSICSMCWRMSARGSRTTPRPSTRPPGSRPSSG